MPYNPSTDLVGLWRAASGGVEKAQMPGLDFVVAALGRAGLMRIVTSQTAPTTNQSTTAWFQPANPSYASEGSLFLWDPSLNMYVPATPELFHSGDSSGGGDGGGGSGGTGMVIISGTAPSNPATGAEWWDGSVLRVFDGTQWKIVGPGGAAGPIPTTTKAFSITQASALSIGTSTWTIVPFAATPSLDGFTGWNATTHVYKPTRAGVYDFFIRGYMTSPTGGWTAINLLKNDQGTYNPNNLEQVCESQFGGAAATTILSCSGMSYMNGTTDFVRMWAYTSDPAGQFLVQNFPNIEAYLLP